MNTHTPLDPKTPYVFMANHASASDIFSLFVAVPFPVRMIAKKQLGRIPFFGWAMHAGRFIFIDRQNPIAARRSIEEAARRIHSGQSVLLFPEGTRTRDGNMGPFKKGGFHLAIASGAAIVPCGIRGSRAVWPRGSALIHSGAIHIEIGEPISTDGPDRRRSRRAAGEGARADPGDDDARRLAERARRSRQRAISVATDHALGDGDRPDLVNHAQQRQALRRRGHAAGGAVAGGEHARDRVGRDLTAAEVDQRADQDAHHVLEERRRLDLDGEDRALAIELEAAHHAHRRAALAVGGAEGAEVVLAAQRCAASRIAARSSTERTCQLVRACSGERTRWFQTR